MRFQWTVVFGLVLGACTASDAGTIALGAGSGACEPTITALVAGRTIDSGTIAVTNTESELVIRVETLGDWSIESLQVYAGIGPVPTTPSGNVAPGRFPHHRTFSPPATEAELRIPLADLGASCGTVLQLAVHADVARVVGGAVVQREGAWGFGTAFSGRQWGWTFSATVCCDPGCTLTQGYWKNHAESWPVPSLDLGGETYTDAELLTILRTPPRGDASLVLAHQLIAAELNRASGASASDAVDDTIAAAHAWLALEGDRLPCRVAASSGPGAEAVAIADVLAAYNEGLLGTPHCD